MSATTSTDRPPAARRSDGSSGEPSYRYAAVFLLVLATVVFSIASPSADWSRAVTIAIEGTAVVFTLATSRNRESIRRRRAASVGIALFAVVILSATGTLPRSLSALIAIVVTVGVPVALLRGLLRLIRRDGVTRNAVAGSLAIYLSIGLIFAWVIGLVAALESTPYFAQHTSGDLGDKVYFSFTALTTTGFGDFTPANPAGHAIAVIEMLIGQLYLVTVIGLLIGNFAARSRSQYGSDTP